MTVAEKGAPSSEGGARGEWRAVKRKAGCLLGCLTEPWVMFVLVIAGVIGGYWWGRRKAQPPGDEKEKPQ